MTSSQRSWEPLKPHVEGGVTPSRGTEGQKPPVEGAGARRWLLTGSLCLAPGCVQSTLFGLKGPETDLETVVSQFSKSPTWMSEREAKG